jgi:hypothetical protein
MLTGQAYSCLHPILAACPEAKVPGFLSVPSVTCEKIGFTSGVFREKIHIKGLRRKCFQILVSPNIHHKTCFC